MRNPFQGGSRRTLAFALGTLLLVGFGCGARQETGVQVTPPTDGGITVDVDADANVGGEVRVVTLTAKQFTFTPAEVRVNQGEKVKLVVTSPDVAHGIAIPAFNVNLNIPAGKTATTEFTADQKGTFPFFCSVFCGSGHGQMRGSLIVE